VIATARGYVFVHAEIGGVALTAAALVLNNVTQRLAARRTSLLAKSAEFGEIGPAGAVACYTKPSASSTLDERGGNRTRARARDSAKSHRQTTKITYERESRPVKTL